MPDRPVNAGWLADKLAQLTGGHKFLMILRICGPWPPVLPFSQLQRQVRSQNVCLVGLTGAPPPPAAYLPAALPALPSASRSNITVTPNPNPNPNPNP